MHIAVENIALKFDNAFCSVENIISNFQIDFIPIYSNYLKLSDI